MHRQPNILLVVADGGRKKGSACYGSFSVGGFPGEPVFGLSVIRLWTAETSTEAEAEILRIAVLNAIDGFDGRELSRKQWGLQIESDSQTLITKLQTWQPAEGWDGDPESLDLVGRAVVTIREAVKDFAEVRYRWVPRAETKARFNH